MKALVANADDMSSILSKPAWWKASYPPTTQTKMHACTKTEISILEGDLLFKYTFSIPE